MNPARFRWGIFFILAGLLLILSNFRYLDWWVWEEILSLWPLLLIAIGVEKIFSNSKVQFIAYLSPVILAIIVLWVAFSGFPDSNLKRSGDAYRYNLEMDPQYKSLTIDFAMDDADLSIRNTSTDDLIRCRFGSQGGNPETEMSESGGEVSLNFEEGNNHGGWININHGRRRSSNRWTASVNNTVPLTLKCSGDNSDMRIDCRELKLQELSVDSDDGDISISIGTLEQIVKVSLEGESADYSMFVPAGAGIRVTGADGYINRRFERIGLIKDGDDFITEGYDTLTPKIELEMSQDITQFSLDYQ